MRRRISTACFFQCTCGRSTEPRSPPQKRIAGVPLNTVRNKKSTSSEKFRTFIAITQNNITPQTKVVQLQSCDVALLSCYREGGKEGERKKNATKDTTDTCKEEENKTCGEEIAKRCKILKQRGPNKKTKKRKLKRPTLQRCPLITLFTDVLQSGAASDGGHWIGAVI